MRQMRYPQSERQGQTLEDYHFHILDLESLLKNQFSSNQVRLIESQQRTQAHSRLLISNIDQLQMIKGMILNVGGNHWVAYIRNDELWYRVDSLNNRGFVLLCNASQVFTNLEHQASELADYGVAIIDPNLDNTRRITDPSSIRFHRG